MAKIVTLNTEDQKAFAEAFNQAEVDRAQVHLWIDELDRGVKVKVGFGIWSPAIGSYEERA